MANYRTQSWRDLFLYMGAGQYTIADSNGAIIYSGYINESSSVNVNNILRNYIEPYREMGFDESERYDIFNNQKQYATFTVNKPNGTSDTVFIYYDYSYVDNEDAVRILSSPINGKFDSRQRVYFSVMGDAEWELESDEFCFYYSTQDNSIETFAVKMEELDFVTVGTDGMSAGYEKKVCGRGALYYINRYGGWDAFVLENNIKKTDKITKDSYTLTSSYNDTTNVHSNKYIKSISTSYKTNSGWLTDKESERLAIDLLESPAVYFDDFESGNIYAVNIDNSSVEIKEFRNGRKMINYDIEFTQSREKIR